MPPTRVAIAGLGAIGRALARRLADGLPGLALACAATRDQVKAQAWLEAQRIACPLVEPEDFPARADIAVLQRILAAFDPPGLGGEAKRHRPAHQ